MTVVQGMVCPRCYVMGGQEHSEGCPGNGYAHQGGAYLDGWLAARDALLPPLLAEIAELRSLKEKP